MKKLILPIILLTYISLSNYSYTQNFEKLPLTLPSISGSVAWGDYNSDGKLDIVIQGNSNGPTFETKLLKNNGDFTFEDINVPFPVNTGYGGIKFADLDNDGLVDFITTGAPSMGSGVLYVYFNNGDGTFQQVALPNAGRTYGSIEINDFNNDGLLDIYTNGAATMNGSGGGAIIIRNLGNRSFELKPLPQIPIGDYQTSKCIDINHDGLVDILQRTLTGLKTFINNGDFIFQEENLVGISTSGGILVVEDFNNDGLLDIITGDNIFIKQIDGSYNQQRLLPTEIADGIQYLVTGDLNNDGFIDICAQILGKLYVFYNDGNGSFSQYEIIENSNNSSEYWYENSIALGDVDNDGDLDIIATNRYYDNLAGQAKNETRIYRNNTPIGNNPPSWNATLKVSINNNNVSFNWKPANDDHTTKKGFKYILSIGKWDDITKIISPIISPSNVMLESGGFPISPSLIAYPEMATIDTFAVRILDKGKYAATVIQIDQSFKVGYYGSVFFDVTNPICPAPIPSVSNVTISGGGTPTLTPSGGTSYVWYNVALGGTSIATGTSFTTPYIENTTSYYVANNDGNCESQRAKITVTVNPIPLSFSSQPIEKSASIGSNVQFTAVANKPSAVYQWQSNPCNIGWQNIPDNSTYSGATTSTLSINNIQLSNYLQPFRVIITKGTETNTSNVALLRITDTCFVSVTDTLIIQSTLVTLTPPNNINVIKVFPNPAKDHMTINFENYLAMSGYTLKINNSLGLPVFSTLINQQSNYIDLSNWSGSGLYFIQLIDNSGKCIEIRKIVLR